MEAALLSILLVFAAFFRGYGQQLTFQNCINYVSINPANYSTDYSSTNPLGYYSGVLPYMDGTKTYPCVTLTGVPVGAYIEVKGETQTAGARLCFGDDNTKRVCGNGQMETCYTAPSTTVKAAFYCDSGCEQTDVSFWYRFVTSETNPSDQWCEGRASDNFPSSLLVAPTNIITSPGKTKPGGKSIRFTPSVILVCVSTLFMLITLRLL